MVRPFQIPVSGPLRTIPGRSAAALVLVVLVFTGTGARADQLGWSMPAAYSSAQDEDHRQTQAVENAADSHPDHRTHELIAPSPFWVFPFVLLLLAIAVLPLIHRTEHWWEHNRSKLTVAAILSLVTLVYYYFRSFGLAAGGHVSPPHWETVKAVFHHAVVLDYIPFIVLLFSLFTISGGINLSGDIPAHPRTNTLILAVGGVLASFIGTTGVSMVLIRPLLQINSERARIKHTVVFFIFIVSNCGGLLLPIGDPPLFLGYLRGVPFTWTLNLWRQWGLCIAALLVIYYLWDSWAYRMEAPRDIRLDEAVRQPLRLRGKVNFLLLLGVVLAVALLVPGKTFPGTSWVVPHELPVVGHLIGLREIVQLALAGLSMLITSRIIRADNKFNFTAIGEVACLFIGIFVTMQVPIEILKIKGASLGIDTPIEFFWATGVLSSFLDNAPTYVVYFETAGTLTQQAGPGVIDLVGGGHIAVAHLIAISCGAVFMGANTYIGNGPNFMVKSIAESAGVKMPSFFGYMLYSTAVLIPLFVVLTFVFMR